MEQQKKGNKYKKRFICDEDCFNCVYEDCVLTTGNDHMMNDKNKNKGKECSETV